MKRWLAVMLIFTAGTAAGGVVVWAVSRDDSDGGSRTRVAADEPKLSAPAQELLDRLDAGQKGTYHVRYSYGGAQAQAVLEVWHKPDRVRRDVTVISPIEGTSRTQEFLMDGRLVRCLHLKDNPWQCVGADSAAAGSLKDPLNGASRDVEGKTVAVSDATIAGHPVKCYEIGAAPPNTKPSVYCLSAEGVPLRIDGGDGKPVEATEYELTVDDGVFKYPAQVAGVSAA